MAEPHWRFFGGTFSFVCLAMLSMDACCAKTVALWSFDDPVGTSRDSLVKDSSGHHYDLELGDGTIVSEGRFGNALHCPAQVSDFVARRREIQQTPLNLGNSDWTLEWWQRRTGPLLKGHVDWVFLLYDETVDASNPSWEAGFQAEARFTGAGLWMHDNVVTWQKTGPMWPCFADKYDEVHRLSFVQDVHPNFYAGRDSRFTHVAWVYDAALKRLMYFEDGKGPFMVRDGSEVAPGNQTHAVYGMLGSGRLQEYPERFAPYRKISQVALYLGGQNVIGPTRATDLGIHKIPRGYELAVRPRSERTAGYLLDEVRISDEVLYREPFSPPGSFMQQDAAEPRLEVTPRRLYFLSTSPQDQPPTQRFTIQSKGDVRAKVVTDSEWISVSEIEASKSAATRHFEVRVDPNKLWPTFHTGHISIQSEHSQMPAQTVEIHYNIQLENSVTWLMDEPLDAPQRMPLEDASQNGLDLALGPGGQMAEGRFGRALDPRGRRKGYAAVTRYIDPTHLNLGATDWTFEGWLRLDRDARAGDVIFELCENLSIGPYPRIRGLGNRMSLSVGPEAQGLEFRADAAGIKQALEVDAEFLSKGAGPWFHLALEHQGSTRTLTLWINGKQQERVKLSANLQRLRATGENTLALGSTVEGTHRWPGRLDEVRVTAARVYGKNFTPPESLTAKTVPLALSLGPQLFVDDYLIAESEHVERAFYQAECPVAQPADWEHFLAQHPNRGDVLLADMGPEAADPAKRFLKYSYQHSFSESEQLGGIYCYYGPTRHGPWVAYEQNPVLPYVWAGMPHAYYSVSDHWPVMFDDRTQQLVMVYKTYPLSGQHPVLDWYRDERFNYQNRVISGFRRHQAVAFSQDGLHWSGQQHILVPDDWDEGETQFQTPKIYRRGDLYIAFVQLLRDDVDRSVASVALATSRDLFHWTRHRAPFLRPADEAKRGDKWFHVEGNTQLYVDADRIVVPFRVGGSHKPPRAFYKGFASVPLDRFASLDSVGSATARVRTPLVQIPHGATELRINAATQPEGEVRVQLLDEQGNPLPGYHASDCQPISGDHLAEQVTWTGGSSLEALAGKNVHIEFVMQKSRLYGFYLTPAGGLRPQDYRQAAAERQAAEPTSDLDQQDLSLEEVRQLLDMPQDSANTQTGISPAVVRIDHTYPENLAYPGDPEPVEVPLELPDPDTRWSIEESIPWLNVKPSQGQGSTQLSFLGHGLQLDAGDYLGKIKIVTNNDPATATWVPVYFRIRASQ